MKRGWVWYGESGQSLVLVAVSMVAMLAMLALILDGGFLLVNRRLMQNAADAGALAGTWELLHGSDPVAVATNYAQLNGAEEVDVTVDYGARTVEVVARKTIPTFFAGVIGVNSFTVSAGATGGLGPGGAASSGWTLFANSRGSDALTINGNSIGVEGSAHSNGGFRINGNSNHIDGGAEADGHFRMNGNSNLVEDFLRINPNAGWSVNGSGNIYPSPTSCSPPGYCYKPLPACTDEDFDAYADLEAQACGEGGCQMIYGDYAFNGNNISVSGNKHITGNLWLNGNNFTLDGFFYVEGDIHINGNRFNWPSGPPVTLVAKGAIHLNGNRIHFETADGSVALFSGVKSVHINGNEIWLQGLVCATHGTAHINGNSLYTAIDGSVIADTIQINGNNIESIAEYNPEYMPPTTPTILLVQ